MEKKKVAIVDTFKYSVCLVEVTNEELTLLEKFIVELGLEDIFIDECPHEIKIG